MIRETRHFENIGKIRFEVVSHYDNSSNLTAKNLLARIMTNKVQELARQEKERQKALYSSPHILQNEDSQYNRVDSV